jgi:hypothetical protein
MLRTITTSLCRVSKSAAVARALPVTLQTANLGTAQKKGSVVDAWNKSCYHEMDFTISEDLTVYDAVERFSAYDVGALVTIDSAGKNLYAGNWEPPVILTFLHYCRGFNSSSSDNSSQRYTVRSEGMEPWTLHGCG